MAFSIVYKSGLNEYALYLDCVGGRGSHRGYEAAMTHLFRNYRKNSPAWKVSIYLSETLLSLLFIVYVNDKVLNKVFRSSDFLRLSERRPSLYQQHRSNNLAEQRRCEESFTHSRYTATMGHLQV